MTHTHLNRAVVSVSDLAAALTFYDGLLGLPALHRAGEQAMLDAGNGVQLYLHQRASQSSDTAVALSFAVADLDTTVAAWAEAGGTVVDEPADQPWGERMAMVRDPDGHLVCLVQQA